MVKKQMIQRVLGIDPGLETIGYGCVESDGINHKLIDGGVIKTTNKDDTGTRLISIHKTLKEIIKELKPQLVSMEKLFFFRNVTSATGVYQAQGVLVMTIKQAKLPLIEYTPLHIKGVLTGYGRSDKKVVKEKVLELLSLDEDIKDDNHADALAVALTHFLQKKNSKDK